MRRDDFELESSSDERDRAYMHDLHIRDSDIRAGYEFPWGPGLPHSVVLASGVSWRRITTPLSSQTFSLWVGATARMLGTFISLL
jgi:hypothetical protein